MKVHVSRVILPYSIKSEMWPFLRNFNFKIFTQISQKMTLKQYNQENRHFWTNSGMWYGKLYLFCPINLKLSHLWTQSKPKREKLQVKVEIPGIFDFFDFLNILFFWVSRQFLGPGGFPQTSGGLRGKFWVLKLFCRSNGSKVMITNQVQDFLKEILKIT